MLFFCSRGGLMNWSTQVLGLKSLTEVHFLSFQSKLRIFKWKLAIKNVKFLKGFQCTDSSIQNQLYFYRHFQNEVSNYLLIQSKVQKTKKHVPISFFPILILLPNHVHLMNSGTTYFLSIYFDVCSMQNSHTQPTMPQHENI